MMNTQTPSLSPGMITTYNRNLLKTFEPLLAHLQFGDEHPFPKNGGTTMSFRKLIPLEADTTTLTEGEPGDAQELAAKIDEMEQGNISDRSGKTWKSSHFENGELIQYWLYDYDERGRNIKTTCYNADDSLQRTETAEFNQLGQQIRSVEEDVNGHTSIVTYEYDLLGRCIKETREDTDPNYPEESYTSYTLISYSDDPRTETKDSYSEDGTLQHRFVVEYDDDGVRYRGSNYGVDENGDLYLDYYVDYIWNEDGSYGGYNLVQVAPVEEYPTEGE